MTQRKLVWVWLQVGSCYPHPPPWHRAPDREHHTALQTRSCPTAAITGDLLLLTCRTLNVKTHFLFTWRAQPLSVRYAQLGTLSPHSAKWGTLQPTWGLLSSVNLSPSCSRLGGIPWSTFTTLRNRQWED